MTGRQDRFVEPGKPDIDLPLTGVRIIKDGKIQEYLDFRTDLVRSPESFVAGHERATAPSSS